MLLIIIIAAIAVAILIYFAFFSGKTAPYTELLEDIGNPSIVEATVEDMSTRAIVTEKGPGMLYRITFKCDDGKTHEFDVEEDTYATLSIGDKNTLVYMNRRFFGFGDHGGLDTDLECAVNNDGFTHDDFDESIDIEQYPEMESRAAFSEDDRRDFARFNAAEKLTATTESFEEITASLEDYPPAALLEKITMYPFLKSDPKIMSLFSRAYNEALNDMHGFDGDSRKGVSADSVYINKNEFRVLIKLQEAPKPLDSTIYMEFSANE